MRPTTDNENYTGGVGNTQYVVGARGPVDAARLRQRQRQDRRQRTGHADGHVPRDVAERRRSSKAPTDGTFTYTPNVGFAGLTDTFTYTLTDGNGVTNTGTVTINL